MERLVVKMPKPHAANLAVAILKYWHKVWRLTAKSTKLTPLVFDLTRNQQ